jgi:DNA-binding ferritin-like protein
LEILQEEAKDETKPHAAEEWLSWQVHLGRYLPVFIEPLREMRRAWSTSKKQRDQETYKQSQKISDALERLLWLFQQEAAQQFAKDAEDALF